MKHIYLDYAATTPVDKRVVKEMQPYLSEKFGNSMSLHFFGQEAKLALENSRQVLADAINADLNEIIFTGSATESNNMALKGIAFGLGKQFFSATRPHIIISSIEHPCIVESAKWLKKQGFEITELPVDKYGFVNPEDVKKAITEKTILVSVIHASNEIGTIQSIAEIGKICRDAGVYFHTDASQSFGKVPIDVKKMNIAGFAKATEICLKEMKSESKRLSKLRDKLIKAVLKIKDSHLNGHPKNRLANNANFWFEFVEGESLIMQLDLNGIACSTGSACSSFKLEPSHVLLATGLKPQEAHGSLRVSLGRFTTKKETDKLIKVLPKIVNKIREISPYGK
ncbi:MAG: cysteine desulfurase family protein [Candidatus Staskawiczbacteria bacterium]|nr:cysteine desulfurase family protein [Candidatus Staskawiczbacteria bacterium]